MASTKKFLTTAAAATLLVGGVLAHPTGNDGDLDYMGPIAFMWPPDRHWEDESHGMLAPCGTHDGVLNRTAFPLSNGALALEQKQQVYDVQISVSFSEDPKSNEDFTPLSLPAIPSLYMSHVCLSLPEGVAAAAAGRNATLQLKYLASYHGDEHSHSHKRHAATNETFYACADITFVETQEFTASIPCFNATAEDHGSWKGEHGHGEEGHDHNSDSEGEEDDDGSSNGNGGSGSGLSKEAIAGVVIASVVGAAAIATLVWFFWRRDRREKRAAARGGGDDVERETVEGGLKA
ncbi:hypothetical protein QBC35DRAFT_446716 [Podospora australis]|uniref:Copper acquisition factor BIM1-like domain-containing protein n=1 Tax=Podospora australis TaxID=1536484 RepID=A0AAN6X681_9PEZI|nr:hypothetical protein QBC35DRAFT_446716 [Podospora australis]